MAHKQLSYCNTHEILVRVIGLEPTRPKAPEPKSGASTNFATPAYKLTNIKKINKKNFLIIFKLLSSNHEDLISFSLIFRHMEKINQFTTNLSFSF